MKIVLILMVRNESRILERCLKAVETVVDAFCIHDTGSTDNTVAIAKEFLANGRKGCVTESTWQNFGKNRTTSFVAAQEYLKAAGWNLGETYGLLLDADMLFNPGNLRATHLTEIGYSVIQVAGNLEYPNCRLVRMDYPWTCVGVTHEYWNGKTTGLSKDICWIDDRNDGGCKSDKFERDAILLEKGLNENPANERYMFYLAQTYHSLGRWKECIAMYKKRFHAGGWDEERWYSLYMIADAHLKLGDPLKFEMYMQKAMRFRPGRAEASYALAKYFREVGQHYKAWYYVMQGRGIPYTTDSLFITKPVYTDSFHYEATMLLYYLDRHAEGLRESMKYLLTKRENLDTVYRNMAFYVKPLGYPAHTHPVPRDAAGADFHPSSICFFGGKQNVRFVNYIIDRRDGSYTMKDGTYSPTHKVRTRNVLWDGVTARLLDDSNLGIEKRETHIEGLEDVRVYTDGAGVQRFVATCLQLSEKIRVVRGRYCVDSGQLTDCEVLHPPVDTPCEKNWIPVPETDLFLYTWNPLQVGTIRDGTLEVVATHETPWFFKHLRGSAVPIRVGGETWVLTHYVEYGKPRKYFHCFVVLDGDHKPVRISLPFVFKSLGIEYCIGCHLSGSSIEFAVSSWDDNPFSISAPVTHFQWIQV